MGLSSIFKSSKFSTPTKAYIQKAKSEVRMNNMFVAQTVKDMALNTINSIAHKIAPNQQNISQKKGTTSYEKDFFK